MTQGVRSEVVCGCSEDLRSAAGLNDTVVFDSIDLSDIYVPDHLSVRERDFEYGCNIVSIMTKAQRLCNFALELEQNSVICALQKRLQETGHRLLLAIAPVNPSISRRWAEATFTSLEYTEHGFRVRDGRFVQEGNTIVRQYVEYDHLFERFLTYRHLTGQDMVAFANAGVTEQHILVNLKAQLFDLLPTADFLTAFKDISVDKKD